MYAIDVEPIPPRNRNNREVHLDYLKHLKKSVETLREIVEEARIERPLDNALENACFYTKRSQELLEYVIGTCPEEFSKRDKKVATTPLTRNKQVTFRETCETSNNNTQTHVEKQNVKKTNVPVILSTGVNSSTEASASKPRSNTKNNRILPAKSDNNKKVEDHLRNNKSNLKQENCVESSISSKRTVIQIVMWYLDSGCSKHMMRNHSRLKNFVKKFIETVRFRNDHFGAIMGYGDYVIGDVAFRKHLCYVRDVDGVELLKGNRGSNLYTISVKDMMKSSLIFLLSKASKNKSWLWHRRLNHLNFGTINDLARKDLQIQVGLNKTVRCLQTDNGTEFVNQVLTEFYESVNITHQKSVPRTPQQNGVVKRRNHTLVEVAQTMLIFSKDLMFLWAEVVATACYTQNRSLIHTCHNKTSYELVHGKKLDLTFLLIFGALCYPTNNSKDLGKLKAKADIRIFVGYAPNRKGYRIYNNRTQQIKETIHVQFDELTGHMDPVHISTGPEPF
ncbi:integrase, catalytic region, zinc finger, CCHC-type containing protein [Tanacetum coccineum]|uniref:Integrase, catalytic region, zinc finger, CCHC-type containing protein n=1 Tax=Tanacetum coccineum TaxID=301880 RepID=A0ABQ5GYH1_9ASTR